MRALIATPSPDFRQTLATKLRESFAISLIGEVADGDAALSLMRSDTWDIALLSVRLPVGGGYKFLTKFRAERPDLCVVMLSYDRYAVAVAACLKAGAKGYVRRDTLDLALVPSVQAALSGDVYPSREVAKWLRTKEGADWQSGV